MLTHRTGSIPVLGTSFRPHGQAVKTSPFHGGNPGSNPGGVTIYYLCGGVAQLARACGSYPQCQGFKSLLRYHFYIIFFYIVVIFGRIAQLGEHLPYKQGVIGSSPIVPTKYGLVVQLVRMLACHARGRGFESHPGRHYFAGVAQLVEQLTCNQ